ncbi:MarR family transcriptional regulator [Demequina sp. B12]|uniref:MarR family winged helix-turn-helix transcriptional regulator n=1 Tax=Demequina sp. B12 TaxID=2992757 RepID=UPI00237A6800|nr:MarR family transcriptional regulator [Demequina sp. B12]MDE0571875.1 MarR family transcriptional regulator [Demequina sp. B12]
MSDKLTFTLHEAVSVIDRAAEQFLQREYGVSGPIFVLLATCEEVEPTDVTSLAQCLSISKAAVSKRLPGLERDGWITLGKDPANARRVVITLTDKSRDVVRRAGAELEGRFAAVFNDPRAAHIDPQALNRDLGIITQILLEKGPLT